MVRKRCGFGLDCAGMMQQPGLKPEDCPNAQVCRLVNELEPGEEVGLYQAFNDALQQLWVTRREAAVMMLMRRGAPQSLDRFGIEAELESLSTGIEQVRSLHTSLGGTYIAPDGSYTTAYRVRRPWGVYEYNKLTHPDAIFAPEVEQRMVKVIHLSKSDDPRFQEGQMGVDRRDALEAARAKLQQAQQAILEAAQLLQGVQAIAEDELEPE